MQASNTGRDPYYADSDIDTSASGVSWPAIFAGAFAATAISAVMIILGSGFGLAVAPTAGKIAVAGIAWLILTQWFASAIGGYLAGRLRTKWVGTHTDEVFFRDTAHGFVTWALATLVSLLVAGSAVSSLVKGITHTAGIVGSGAAMGAATQADHATQGNSAMSDPNAYFVDSLFRADHPASGNGTATPQNESEMNAQAARIIMTGLKNDEVPPADKTYLAQLVSARTGLSQPDAEKRVNDVIEQIKQAEAKAKDMANTARKAGATVSIFMALSMFVGAFVASIAAALGGKRRDVH